MYTICATAFKSNSLYFKWCACLQHSHVHNQSCLHSSSSLLLSMKFVPPHNFSFIGIRHTNTWGGLSAYKMIQSVSWIESAWFQQAARWRLYNATISFCCAYQNWQVLFQLLCVSTEITCPYSTLTPSSTHIDPSPTPFPLHPSPPPSPPPSQPLNQIVSIELTCVYLTLTSFFLSKSLVIGIFSHTLLCSWQITVIHKPHWHQWWIVFAYNMHHD